MINKPANSDLFTEEFLNFIDKFQSIIPEKYPYMFFICGGALSVENAIKVSMDWKYNKNLENNNKLALEKNYDDYKVLHFESCFHGRSGYTMPLTNTDVKKIKYFTKHNWPRVKPSVIDPKNNVEQPPSSTISTLYSFFDMFFSLLIQKYSKIN